MKRKSWKRVISRIFAVFVVGAMFVNIGLGCISIVSPVAAWTVDSQEDICDVSSFEELEAALADDSVSEINLTSHITLTEELTITQNITIDGKGHVMTGSGIHRGFEINSGVTAVIKNVTITGIDSGGEYSGVFHNLGTLIVENCILKNNKSTYSAVILEATRDSVQVFRNCQMLNNESEGQGSVFQNYLSPSQTTFDGCIIAGNKNNLDDSSGGAICFREDGGDVVINGCILSDNTNSDFSAYSSGIEIGDNVQIKNSVFGAVYGDRTDIIENAEQNGSKQINGLSILNDDGTLKEIDTSTGVITTANCFVWSDDYKICTMKIMKVYSTGIITEDHECTVSSANYKATAEQCGRTTYTAEITIDGIKYTDTKDVITQHYSLDHYHKGDIVTVSLSANKFRCGKIVECYYCSICDKYFYDAEGKQEILKENLFKSDESSEIYNPYGLVMYEFYYYPEFETGNLNFNSFFDFLTYEIPSEINGYAVTSVSLSPEFMHGINNKLTSLFVPESVTLLNWLYGCDSLEKIMICNRNTEIYGLENDSKNLTVYGYAGSTAETYVNDYNSDENHAHKINFVAVDGLVADYSKVDTAIAKANALNKDNYKDFSAVEKAIQAVVRGKNITKQREVDAMAKAIEDAIKALVKKGSISYDIPTVDINKPVKNITIGVQNINKAKDIIVNSVDKELQAKIQNKVDNGADVGIVVSIDMIDQTKVSEDVKKDISKINDFVKDKGMKLLQYFDITIQMVAGNDVLGNVSETKETLTFQVAIPNELQKEGRIFKIVRIHAGKIKVLDIQEKDGILTFESDQFSTYALTYSDKVETTITPNSQQPVDTNKPTDKVDTSDEINISFHLMVCGTALSLGLLYVLKRKSVI